MILIDQNKGLINMQFLWKPNFQKPIRGKDIFIGLVAAQFWLSLAVALGRDFVISAKSMSAILSASRPALPSLYHSSPGYIYHGTHLRGPGYRHPEGHTSRDTSRDTARDTVFQGQESQGGQGKRVRNTEQARPVSDSC